MSLLPTGFDAAVWKLLKRIPRGKVSTYKRIAIALGKPNAARAVGNACKRNPSSPNVPCHRVVRGDGSLGGFAGGTRKKIALLKGEGIVVVEGRALDLDKRLHRFDQNHNSRGKA